MVAGNVEAASGLWRSEDMTKLTIVMQREAVHDTLFFLGREGIAQLIDMQRGVTAFQRPYTAEIRRCDELERRLRYFAEQMNQAGVSIQRQTHETVLRKGGLDALEVQLDRSEREVRELTASVDQLTIEVNRCREYMEVEARNVLSTTSYEAPDLTAMGPPPPPAGIMTIAGTILATKIDSMTRLVWRVSRGNCFIRSEALPEPFIENKLPVLKSVFIIYGSSRRVMERVQKVCATLGATVYTMANEAGASEKMQAQKRSVEAALEQSKYQLRVTLERLASVQEASLHSVQAEKAICTMMNMLSYSGSLAKAQVWIPTADRDRLNAALAQGSHTAGASVQSIVEDCEVGPREVHPTFFRTNMVTSVFQGIVDSYGTARYKEVNPGVFTIVTFPYLFGIMYGDIGHGVMLTIFAAVLICLERKFLASPQQEIFAMIFGGRYLLLMMGVFAIYVGVLYNDFFGFSLGLFKSAYTWPVMPPEGPRGIVTPTEPNGHPNVAPETPYAFGIDVAWTETENKLEFYNSIKMKCAVIIGVTQMTVGLFFSLMNHLRNRDYKKIFFGFIPELIFLLCTFGYMSLLIIIKWCTKWENTHVAPSLLETMTNFFLSPGTVTEPLYSGQAGVQVVLLLVAFAQIPVMLLVIPIMERRKHARRLRDAHDASERQPLSAALASAAGAEESGTVEFGDFLQQQQPQQGAAAAGSHGEDDVFDFSEVMIHYIIHTIEFVLGCVSNTASYLRLWALSLAHAELSEVFLSFGLLNTLGMDSGSGVILMAGFAAWLGATCMVLLMMESLSAFLHALRLHWVEFQNKFFAGDGTAFEPFSLREELNMPVV